MPFFTGHLDLLKVEIIHHMETQLEDFLNLQPTHLKVARQILETEISNPYEIKRCLNLIEHGQCPVLARDQNADPLPNEIVDWFKWLDQRQNYVNYSTPLSKYREDLQNYMCPQFSRVRTIEELKTRPVVYFIVISSEGKTLVEWSYEISINADGDPVWHNKLHFNDGVLYGTDFLWPRYEKTVLCDKVPNFDARLVWIFRDYANYRKIITIQRWWREQFYNPESKICQKWVARVQKIFDKS